MANLRQCPQCRSNDIYRKLVQVRGFTALQSVGSWLFGSGVWMFICGGCGHLEFSIPKKHLKKIREEFDLA